MKKTKVGLIINPVAGLGGSVGLKGTDDVVTEALARGAQPKSEARTHIALQEILSLRDEIIVYAGKGALGEQLSRQLGFMTHCCDETITGDSEDTIRIARKLREENVSVILFAGGDGTARDIYSAIGTDVVVIGIPTGVKIHSPVFCKKPIDAGKLLYDFLRGSITQVREAEVLDIDEASYRKEVITTSLYGYLRIPNSSVRIQNRKTPTPISEATSIELIAHDVIETMQKDTYYIIGAGTTTRGIMQKLGLDYSLIGLDIVYNKKLVAKDVYGENILSIIGENPCKLVITVTGTQGFLFGRGNQQLTAEVLRVIKKDNIIVLATKEKLISLGGRPLSIDTGDGNLDKSLSGYYRVITSYRERIIYPAY